MPGQNTMMSRFVYTTLGAILGATALFLWIWWVTHQPGTKGGDEERPPIIVSDGSLEFNAGRDRTHHEKGSWEKVAGQKKWYHDHTGQSPAYLAVNVLHGKDVVAGSHCEEPNYYFNFPTDYATVSIAYGDGTSSISVSLEKHSDEKNYFTVSPTDNGRPLFLSPSSMRVGDDTARLYSITFTPATGAPVVCNLANPDAHLLFFQRTLTAR